jgi:sulfatase maturation enzyme AslB (radical SAM superfamily)
MVIRDPCKKCIIGPICNDVCEKRRSYDRFHYLVKDPETYAVLIFALLAWVFAFTPFLDSR